MQHDLNNVVGVRLPDATKDILDEMSKNTGLPTSAVIRALIIGAVGPHDRASRIMMKMMRHAMPDGTESEAI